jgi:hypothetical protein
MLSIALLGGAIVMMGELVRLGARNAELARELTRAQLLAESAMQEIAAGITTPDAVADVPTVADPNWLYSVESLPTDTPGLLQVTVTVTRGSPGMLGRELSYSVVRLVRDPSVTLGVDYAALAEEQAAASESSSTSSSSSSSSGSGSSGAGS